MAASTTHGALRYRLRAAAEATYPPLLIAVAYYLGAEAAFYIGTLSDRIFAPFWPPNVVLLSALLLVPMRRWWIRSNYSTRAAVRWT